MSNFRIDTPINQRTTIHRILRPIAFAFIPLVAASPLAAQGINGTWITEFERMMRNQNGEVSGGEKARAKIVLQQKGDSVTGTWELLDPGNAVVAPRQLRGTIAGNEVSLTGEFEATVNLNGEQSVRKLAVLYVFTVNGDALEGTMTNKSGDMEMPARPFKAWRDKA